MGKSRITLLLAMGAALAAFGAETAEAPKPKSDTSDTVTVTAEAEPVELVKTPNPVLVVGKQAIESSGAPTLSGLLQDILPGQVLSTGGVGASSSIYLGGSRPQDTIVTLDGMRLNDASGLGGVSIGLLGLTGIDRVELQKGPSSTRFGSDALGGAIALYSAGSAPEGFSGDLVGKVGTRNTRGAQLGTAYGWNSGWLRTIVGAQRTEPATEAANDFRATNTFVGFGQQLGSETLLTLSYLNAYAGTPIPIVFASYGTTPRPDYTYNEKREAASRTQLMSGSLKTSFTATLRGELTFGQVDQERLEPLPDGKPGRRYSSRRNQVTGAMTWDLAPGSYLQLGGEGYEEFAWAPDALNGEIRNNAQARHVALLVEGGFEPIRDVLRVVASVRGQRDRQTISPLEAPTRETRITQTTGKVGLNWTITKEWRAYTSAGTGFSNPLLSNTLWNAHYDGENLGNEKSKYVQVGVGYQSGPWSGDLELWRTLYDSVVYYDPDGGVWIPDWFMNSGVYRNGSGIRIQGAELSGGYATDTWGLKGFYRNQDARDTSVPDSERYKTNAVLRRPFQSFGFSGYRVLGPVRLEGRWSWFGSRYEYGLPSAFKAHYNDVSVAATWTVSEALSLALRGDNLLQREVSKEDYLARTHDFDNDTSQVYGYPAQPATWTLEARYRF